MDAEEIHQRVSELLDARSEIGEYTVIDRDDSRRVDYKWAGDALYHMIHVWASEGYLIVSVSAKRRIDMSVILLYSDSYEDGVRIETDEVDGGVVWDAVSEIIDRAVNISLDDVCVQYEKTGSTLRLVGCAEAFDIDELDMDTASVREVVGYEPDAEGIPVEWDRDSGEFKF